MHHTLSLHMGYWCITRMKKEKLKPNMKAILEKKPKTAYINMMLLENAL